MANITKDPDDPVLVPATLVTDSRAGGISMTKVIWCVPNCRREWHDTACRYVLAGVMLAIARHMNLTHNRLHHSLSRLAVAML
jgi:hypothetical protein